MWTQSQFPREAKNQQVLSPQPGRQPGRTKRTRNVRAAGACEREKNKKGTGDTGDADTGDRNAAKAKELPASVQSTPAPVTAPDTPPCAAPESAWRRQVDSAMEDCVREISDIAAFHEDSLVEYPIYQTLSDMRQALCSDP